MNKRLPGAQMRSGNSASYLTCITCIRKISCGKNIFQPIMQTGIRKYFFFFCLQPNYILLRSYMHEMTVEHNRRKSGRKLLETPELGKSNVGWGQFHQLAVVPCRLNPPTADEVVEEAAMVCSVVPRSVAGHWSMLSSEITELSKLSTSSPSRRRSSCSL